ncbi:MAG: RHS repeat-associated core domain-containing protein [Demequinaceae bacterium]|nr:RHS repeat-associated core domain-containing protein [Demequinaceae bacterium]
MTQSVAAGASAVTGYDYSAVHPAAVTSTTTGTTTDEFTYDGAGRMDSRTVDDVTTALDWDVTSSLVESGKPDTENAASTGQGGHIVYAYDASGQRVAQAVVADATHTGTATAYVVSGEVTDKDTAVPAAASSLEATRYYSFGGATVAVRTSTGLALVLGDEPGSVSVTMPLTVDTVTGVVSQATVADAQAVTRTAYTPFGVLRGDDNLALSRGWLGQVEDRVSGEDGETGTGLTYLNARYYDPVLGRFLSPDPLMNPGDPKTLDPYRGADNNPVVFTDATGLAPRFCTPIGPRNYQSCQTIGGMAMPDNAVGAGYIDGSTDRLYAIGYGFPPEGIQAGVTAFQQENEQNGFWTAVAHVGSSPLAPDDMAEMASCASGPIVCNPYDLGHSGGGLGTSTATFGALATASIFASETGYGATARTPNKAPQLLEAADRARAGLMEGLQKQGIDRGVVGAYDVKTGSVVAAASSGPKACVVFCAESAAQRLLISQGSKASDIGFSKPFYSKKGTLINVCAGFCQDVFTRDQFPVGTKPAPGGRWTRPQSWWKRLK